MVCTRLGSLLRPLFYFLDDVSYPQSVEVINCKLLQRNFAMSAQERTFTVTLAWPPFAIEFTRYETLLIYEAINNSNRPTDLIRLLTFNFGSRFWPRILAMFLGQGPAYNY